MIANDSAVLVPENAKETENFAADEPQGRDTTSKTVRFLDEAASIRGKQQWQQQWEQQQLDEPKRVLGQPVSRARLATLCHSRSTNNPEGRFQATASAQVLLNLSACIHVGHFAKCRSLNASSIRGWQCISSVKANLRTCAHAHAITGKK